MFNPRRVRGFTAHCLHVCVVVVIHWGEQKVGEVPSDFHHNLMARDQVGSSVEDKMQEAMVRDTDRCLEMVGTQAAAWTVS